ncbi:MAG: hypothetical protein M1825_002231 [Sarcosagium campestre]|nr:MAG: hypothetical protein M1825_002231 [Sarcosagium campestre]
MPDKPLTIATYAAGASLAAITLVYVFGPTYFIDGNSLTGSSNMRRKGVVGLLNPANDCFINSVLQSLSGLGELRIYLIREMHRRTLDDPKIYATRPDASPSQKTLTPTHSGVEDLQRGIVTQALKDVLDSLNERPIYKKTISAGGFISVLENAFKQRVSRQQQDAQEFLQLVAERLCEEYHAGSEARRRARIAVERDVEVTTAESTMPEVHLNGDKQAVDATSATRSDQNGTPEEPSSRQTSVDGDSEEEEAGFPMEGRLESQIECLTCHYKSKPSVSSFVTLTLHVPRQSSTSLNTCFDGLFQTEYIDDFKCDYCRLTHAIEVRTRQLRLAAEADRAEIETALRKLKDALARDPESPPKDVELPDIKTAPKRRISRSVRVSAFPKIIAIHLSRSIFDAASTSTKNSAKVSFPENLSLGGILDRVPYKLLGIVTHKGSHNSGHYESFRRQGYYPPFSTPNAFSNGGVYANGNNGGGTPSAAAAAAPSSPSPPRLSFSSTSPSSSSPNRQRLSNETSSPLPSPSSLPSQQQQQQQNNQQRNSTDTDSSPLHLLPPPSSSTTSAPATPPASTSSTTSPLTARPSSDTVASHNTTATTNTTTATTVQSSPSPSPSNISDFSRFRPSRRNQNHRGAGSGSGSGAGAGTSKYRPSNRWWRISDDKVRESKTSEVLGMQREVYLLFYEFDRNVAVASL